MGIAERKEREKERRANEIIDAAEKVFFEKGLANATMDDVAEMAELSKGTLYLYFKNKDSLLFEVFRRALTCLLKTFEKEVNPESNGFENLLETGRAYVNFSSAEPVYFEIMSRFDAKEAFEPDDCTCKLHEETEEFVHTRDMCKTCTFNVEEVCPMGFLTALIEKGMNDGSIRDDIEPVLLAHLLWLQTMGVIKLAKESKSHLQAFGLTEEGILAGYIQVLSNGIKKQ